MTFAKIVGVLLALMAFVVFMGIRQERADARATLAAMRLLSDGAWWYGLALVKASAGELSRGVVYVHLGRLEGRGLVTSKAELVTPAYVGITRRVYRITDAGRQWLERQGRER